MGRTQYNVPVTDACSKRILIAEVVSYLVQKRQYLLTPGGTAHLEMLNVVFLALAL